MIEMVNRQGDPAQTELRPKHNCQDGQDKENDAQRNGDPE